MFDNNNSNNNAEQVVKRSQHFTEPNCSALFREKFRAFEPGVARASYFASSMLVPAEYRSLNIQA